MYLKTIHLSMQILDSAYRIRRHSCDSNHPNQGTFQFNEPSFHILDWITDKIIKPTISHTEKLWKLIKTLSAKEIVTESAKRVPAFAITDTVIFLTILYFLGYTITTTLAIAIFIKALLIASIIAPISFIVRKYTQG